MNDHRAGNISGMRPGPPLRGGHGGGPGGPRPGGPGGPRPGMMGGPRPGGRPFAPPPPPPPHRRRRGCCLMPVLAAMMGAGFLFSLIGAAYKGKK